MEVNNEYLSVNEISNASEIYHNITSDSMSIVDYVDDSPILKVSDADCLKEGNNYANHLIGGVEGTIELVGDDFIFHPVDRQDIVIKKDVNSQYRNDKFQIYKMLPTSFIYGNYIYVLREPNKEISNEWYYDKIYLSQTTETYILRLEAPYGANGSIGGFAGDKMVVTAFVTDSKGNPADGCVVFDDLIEKSAPIRLIGGYASYGYTLKYTGRNGGFIHAYYYEGSFSDANLRAQNKIKYIGLTTTYVFEFDQKEYYYFDDNKWVTFNIYVYNKDKPWKEVSGKIQGTFTRGIWTGDGIHPRDIVWDSVNQRGTASFTLFVEGRTFVGFRLMPGNTIHCDEYYCPVKYLRTPFIYASINRVGSQINVNMSFENSRHQAIGFGEATLDIPSINKKFRFDVTNKAIQFSFTQEDYLNKNTIFSISYHDDKGFFADGKKDIVFQDTIYVGKSLSITNLRFVQGSDLTPKVTINSYSPLEKQGFVKLKINGKTYINEVVNGVCQFRISDYYAVGSYDAIFEYYYDNLHLVLSEKVSITITPFTDSNELDFVITNEWIYGDVLKPKIQVVKDGVIISKGIVAHWVTTSTIDHYLNDKPVYKRFLEECSLSNGYASFDLGKTEGPYTEEFYFYYDSYSNTQLNKSLRFKQVRRSVELESVDHIDITVGEKITFVVSIKNYAELLEKIPIMKRSDSYYKPCVYAKTHENDIKRIKEDYNSGTYTFVYSPTQNAETISFYINSLYIRGELVIPVNLKKLDPIMELENNGTISLLNKKIGIKFANDSVVQGSLILTTDEYNQKFEYLNSANKFSFYEIPFSTPGEKKIHVVYKPNIYAPYNGFEKDILINMVKETPTFSFSSYEGKFGQSIPVIINVGNVSDVYPTGDVTLTFNNKELQTKINQNNIKFNLLLPDKPGNYPVKIYYAGDNLFDSISSTFDVVVNKQDISLFANNSINVKSNEEISLKVTGVSEFNSKVILDYVNVNLGNTIKCDVVNDYIKFTAPQEINFNSIKINFLGNEYYNSASKTIDIFKVREDIKINTSLTASNVAMVYNGGKSLDATLKDKDGKAVSGAKVTVKVGNVIKTLTTDKNGQVSLSLNGIVPNAYTATITFDGDSIYAASSASAKITINKQQAKIFLRNALYFVLQTKMVQVTLWDANNNPIAGKTVYLKLDEYTWRYSGVTDENGNAYIKVGVGFGVHGATVSFEGDENYTSNSKTGAVRVIKETPSLMLPGKYAKFKASDATKTVKIYLKDRYNKPLLPDTRVFIKVNGQTYSGQINNEGIASINLKINSAGTYNAELIYMGNTAYNKVTRQTKITIV